MSSRSSRLGWQFLLAAIVLLMQHAGVLHSLRHATRDEGMPADHSACLECLAHHAHDGAVSHAEPVLALATCQHTLRDVDGLPQCEQGICQAYRPRGPPTLAFA